ncbi:SDR family NAD(P)-dependent oxidoreductase [Actinacidiphila guanduensis]|uniref:NADP-dependent 3-hydroxy acid dehydrogenase YdfG n=1 Tax=Actinacidiphila guanduensis TaxID=310781 RepID=A0A1H0LAF2_9ACTN|nr:SDR family NAD(P)-dependent oxidoreductase [Actinacidiphila guanduensis]SDO65105.1 NADP-dependent 3-hydroxy acid dehydrogenase YdfG [Actinacidiphila guanduensis]
MTSRTWFITGASRGLGAQWARTVLDRGDRVAATARTAASLQPLAEQYADRVLPLAFDVADAAAVRAAVAATEERFGGIDVLVNNAGHMLVGAVEEVTDEQAKTQLDVNFLGPLWTTRAVLPGMRERGGGRILQVSSLGGVVAYPSLGLYHASKWALEALSQSLAAEVAAYNIHVTLIEPVVFHTGLMASSPQARRDDAYGHAREALFARAAHIVPGDVAASGRALLELADAEEPPLRVLFGVGGLEEVREEYARRLEGWQRWDALARTAHGSAPEGAQAGA